MEEEYCPRCGKCYVIADGCWSCGYPEDHLSDDEPVVDMSMSDVEILERS